MGSGCFGSDPGAHGAFGWLRQAPVWKAGVEVLDEPWRGEAAGRALLVVMADGDVLHNEVLPAADVRAPTDAAAALKSAVDSIAAEARCYPRKLLVHDSTVAEHLGPRVACHGTTVRAPASLRQVRNAIRKLARVLDEPDVAWDLYPLYENDEKLDPAFATLLFPAAARFWRARPWERLPDETKLRFRWRDRRSVVVLTHPKGHGHVVTLFTDVRDYDDQRGWSPRRPVLGIRFQPASGLPRALRRQIAAQGWEVAGPDAHPLLMGDVPDADGDPAFTDILQLVAVLARLAK